MAEDGHDEGGLPDTRPSPGALPEPLFFRSGDVVGDRWRLDHFLDGGGMGMVWQATDLRLDEAAAVKLLNPHLVRTEDARERFLREARAAARLRGLNVVSVYDFAIDRGTPYMAMELLRGESLAARLRRGPLGWLAALALVRDVGRAIARAHRAGIVHRDLKPGNVFLAATEEGTVAKVLDFGIAKLASLDTAGALTASGAALGTPNYMSPEQVADAKGVDRRADVWALAVIVYECLVGERAFPGSVPLAVLQRIREGAPTPASERASVPPGFDAWFSKATALHPDGRFSTIEELVDGLAALEPDEGTMLPAPPPPRALRARAWASDAHQVDIDAVEQVVFENAVVREFVEDDRRYFVSGAKGCGKTLLLTVKRARLASRYQPGKGAARVTFIPEGRPYLDLMSDLRTLGRSVIDYMSDLGNTKRLWGFALRLSIVSHSSAPALPTAVLAGLPPELRAVAEGEPTEPTVVAKAVLGLSISQIHQTLQRAEMALERAVRTLHSGFYLFVDKIDQALRGVSREAWVAMQAGLVEAAWDLMNTNAHVKVYATIREEAFSAYESDIKTNLFGALTRLRYSKEDLRHILERLTSYYEGVPLRDFVSLDMVQTGETPLEPAFDHLHRHTLGRPRDFVIVASEISRRRAELDERVFKDIVQETCASILVANVFDEMRVFLEVLDARPERLRFLGVIPFPALRRDDLIDAWCLFHGVERGYFENYAQGADDVFHPFRELYDCGLLGYVLEDPEAGEARQRFKQPHHPLDAHRHDLPASEIYLLHPSLLALMRRLGLSGGATSGLRGVVVGHDRPWRPHHALLARVGRELARFTGGGLDDRGIGHAVNELLGELARRAEQGQDLSEVRRALAATETFERLTRRLEHVGWDELHLALLDAFPPDDAPTRS